MTTKPKTNYTTTPGVINPKDLFQTPAYALDPLLPYLERFSVIRESACGEGYLVRALQAAGKTVVAHDLQSGTNRFDTPTPLGQCEVTNVPFGLKYRWIEQALRDGQPFALLMPSDVLFAGAKFQPLLIKHGLQLLVPNRRINFKTPLRGWEGSAAQMHCSWVTWQLCLPERVTFCEITPRKELPL